MSPSLLRAALAGAAVLAVTVPVGAATSPLTPAPPAPAPALVEAAVVEHLARRAAPRPASRAATARARWLAANATRRAAIARYARAQVGKWYGYGQAGPRRFDCSGLVLASARRGGVQLPRRAAAQSRRGREVARRYALVGDLVFWGRRGGAHHVGIVVYKRGNVIRIVDAPGSGRRIAYRAPWAGARYVHLIG